MRIASSATRRTVSAYGRKICAIGLRAPRQFHERPAIELRLRAQGSRAAVCGTRRTAAGYPTKRTSSIPPRQSVQEPVTGEAMNVSDFFWKRMSEWGIRRVFGYPGDGINGLMGGLARADGKFEFVQARHEELAAFMAC